MSTSTITPEGALLEGAGDEVAQRPQLRLVVAGSVDDGKSTLVGRLLYDTKSILADQYEAIEAASLRRGASDVDLALLTDGLRAEREQGITTSPTVTSPPRGARSSSRTRPATPSTPATR